MDGIGLGVWVRFGGMIATGGIVGVAVGEWVAAGGKVEVGTDSMVGVEVGSLRKSKAALKL